MFSMYSGHNVYFNRFKCVLNAAKTNFYLTLHALINAMQAFANSTNHILEKFKAFSKQMMRFRNYKRFRCSGQSNQSFIINRLPFVFMRFSNEMTIWTVQLFFGLTCSNNPSDHLSSKSFKTMLFHFKN